jgi:hypothetical protein
VRPAQAEARSTSSGQGGTKWLRLAGLEPGARYRDRETGEEHSGAALMTVGLGLAAGADFGSTLIRLRRR